MIDSADARPAGRSVARLRGRLLDGCGDDRSARVQPVRPDHGGGHRVRHAVGWEALRTGDAGLGPRHTRHRGRDLPVRCCRRTGCAVANGGSAARRRRARPRSATAPRSWRATAAHTGPRSRSSPLTVVPMPGSTRLTRQPWPGTFFMDHHRPMTRAGNLPPIPTLGYAILALLSRGPLTGAELSSQLRDPIGLYWEARHSQIYPALSRLAYRGWIASPESAAPGLRPRRRYEITADGLDALRAWVASPPSRRSHRDELLLRVYASWVCDRDVAIEMLRRAEARTSRSAAGLSRTPRHRRIERRAGTPGQCELRGLRDPSAGDRLRARASRVGPVADPLARGWGLSSAQPFEPWVSGRLGERDGITQPHPIEGVQRRNDGREVQLVLLP